MSDRLISAEKLAEILGEQWCDECMTDDCYYCNIYQIKEIIRNMPTVDAEPKWIPITSRPMDDEERIEWSEKLGYDIEYDDAIIYTSQLPDDGEEVLTCSLCGTIRIDTFQNDPDDGCYFEDNGEMDGIVAWMPLPKPYRTKMDEVKE